MHALRLGIAQINPTVGDLTGNTKKIVQFISTAKSLKVDLLVFPELALTGSPPEGLVLNPQFVLKNIECLQEVICNSTGISLVLGFVDNNHAIYNAAAIVIDGKLVNISHKAYLSNEFIFGDRKYFTAGAGPMLSSLYGVNIKTAIGEDVWHEPNPSQAWYNATPDLLISINANPHRVGSIYKEEDAFIQQATKVNSFIAYSNLIGGQDGLVFPGGSFIMGNKGELIVRGQTFAEDLIVADLNVRSARSRGVTLFHIEEQPSLSLEKLMEPSLREAHDKATSKPSLSHSEVERLDELTTLYNCLILGTRDYVYKNGFTKVVMGLSGGIDSSLVATIATEALGAENVIGVFMPSRYSSADSKSDVETLACNLGIKLRLIPIEKTFQAYLDMLSLSLENNVPGITEQNLQARVRANILFALSNKFGWMVLACSNKSELATGYGTLYGDIAGGFTILKDIYKTLVFKLASHKNLQANKEIIPTSILKKDPSAELAPNQKDTDTLPPYEILDQIIKAYMDNHMSVNQIVAMGYSQEIVMKVAHLISNSEYKRRQAPPGVIISSCNSNCLRRTPISNLFRT